MKNRWCVRPVRLNEFDGWARLYRAYAENEDTPTSDEHRAKVWSWIHDDAAIECLVALRVDADGRELGEPQALAHLREWVRPLRGAVAGYLDDLFVDPEHRGSGAVNELFNAIDALAIERRWSIVRWTTAEDNYRARAVYDRLAARTTWVTYDRVGRA